jgi:hypothetical protein
VALLAVLPVLHLGVTGTATEDVLAAIAILTAAAPSVIINVLLTAAVIA